MTDFFDCIIAFFLRGIFVGGEEGTVAWENAHRTVGKFIRAPGIENIVFTRNTTESLNLLAYSLRAQLTKNNSIVISRMEHHSNLIPWQQAASATGAKLRYAELTKDGQLDYENLDKQITKDTKTVAITASSNALGTRVDVKAVADRARDVGAISIIDAAQLVPHQAVDVRKLGCDFLAFSSHKMYGPHGLGVLYGKKEALEALPPFMFGGEMIKEVHYDRATWNDLPWKFEAGTPAVADAVGLAAAIEYLDKLGMENVQKHEQQLTKLCYDQLAAMKGIRILGPAPPKRGSLVAFTMESVHPHDITSILDQEGVAVRAGHHCTMPLHELLKITASARASFGIYNVPEDVHALVDGLKKVQKLFA